MDSSQSRTPTSGFKAIAAAFIRQVAAQKAVCAEIVDAEGFHSVAVMRDGSLRFGAYAGESVTVMQELEDLPWRELGHLLDACAKLGHVI